MKPCAENRKALTWLTLNALEPKRADALRLHLATCPGCRQYADAMATLVREHERVAEVFPMVHRNTTLSAAVERRLQADADRPAILRWLTDLRDDVLALRPGVAFIGAAVMVVCAVIAWASLRSSSSSTQGLSASAPASQRLATESPSAPTLACYRVRSSRSPDVLDELLSRQAVRAVSGFEPPAFTAFRRTVDEP